MCKVMCLGLPRSGGQTLQAALQMLYPGEVIWHSPGNKWADMDSAGPWRGAVEVFAPPRWIRQHYSNVKFIVNYRQKESWLKSCQVVYPKSPHWNHPIWKYPLSQFIDYYDAYYDAIHRQLEGENYLFTDFTVYPVWQILCTFLGKPVPKYEFPNVDSVRRIDSAIISPKYDFTNMDNLLDFWN